MLPKIKGKLKEIRGFLKDVKGNFLSHPSFTILYYPLPSFIRRFLPKRKVFATALLINFIAYSALPFGDLLFEKVFNSKLFQTTAQYTAIKQSASEKYRWEATNQDLKAFFGDKTKDLEETHRFSILKGGSTLDLRLTRDAGSCSLNQNGCNQTNVDPKEGLKKNLEEEQKRPVTDVSSLSAGSEKMKLLKKQLEDIQNSKVLGKTTSNISNPSSLSNSSNSLLRATLTPSGFAGNENDQVSFIESKLEFGKFSDFQISYEVVDQGVKQTLIIPDPESFHKEFLLSLDDFRVIKVADSQYLLVNREQTAVIQIGKPITKNLTNLSNKTNLSNLSIFQDPRGIILAIDIDQDFLKDYFKNQTSKPLIVENIFSIGSGKDPLVRSASNLVDSARAATANPMGIEPGVNQDFAFEQLNIDFQVGFGSKTSKSRLSVSDTTQGAIGLDMALIDEKRDATIKKDTKLVEQEELEKDASLLSSNPSDSSISSVESSTLVDSVRAEEVQKGVDLEYKVYPGGVKENIVVKHKDALGTLGTLDTLSFSYALNLYGLVPSKGADEIWRFYPNSTNLSNESNLSNSLFHFPAPFAEDSSGIRGEATIDITSWNGCNATLANLTNESNLSNCFKVTVQVDKRWLIDESRTYPVYIDPSIADDTTAEFAITDNSTLTSTMNHVKDTASPQLETYYQELPVDISTAALWHFNNAWTDSSGNGNTLTAAGNAAFTTSGKLGSHAATLDGTGDYASMSDNASVSVADIDFTVEAWVYLTTATSEAVIAAHTDIGSNLRSWQLAYDNMTGSVGDGDDRFRFQVSSTGTAQDGAVAADTIGQPVINTWYHIVAWHDAVGDRIGIAVNGGPPTITAYSSGVNNSTGTFSVGTRFTSGANQSGKEWTGYIDEVKLTKKLLTPEEIRLDALRRPYGVYTSNVFDLTANVTSIDSLTWTEGGVNTGSGETLSSSTSLVAQWNFNETSGTTADNAETTASRDGTLTSFASTSSQDQAAGTGWTANDRRWGAGALNFDGTNDWVDVGQNILGAAINGASTYTITAWVKPPKVSATRQRIINWHINGDGTTGATLSMINSTVEFGSRSQSADSLTLITVPVNELIGQWMYVVVVVDVGNDNTKIYINGVLKISQSITFGAATYTNGTVTAGAKDGIGAYDTSASTAEYFQGTIDSTAIFTRALALNEILSNYNHSNIEFQTRTGATTTPNDGTWEAWKPTTNESELGTTGDMDGAYQYTSISGLTSYWPMDETSGTTTNDRYTSNNGTDTNGVLIVDGKFGKGRGFDGTNDYIDMGNPVGLQILYDHTIEAWIKLGTTGANQTIVSKYSRNSKRSFRLMVNSSNQLQSDISVDGSAVVTTTSTQTLTSGVWYYVATTYTLSTSVKLYINGQLDTTNTTSIPASLYNTATSFNIGRNLDASDVAEQYFNGSIDEVLIYGDDMTAATILEHNNEGTDNWGVNNITNSTDTSLKVENTGSQKTVLGAPKVDSKTVGLYHLDETDGDGKWVTNSVNSPNNLWGNGAESSLTTGLISYWGLDEGANNLCSGGTNDVCDKAGANDGAITGTSIDTSTVKNGKARSFSSATPDRADMGDDSDLKPAGSTISVSAWLKTSINNAYQGVVTKYSAGTTGYALQTDNTGKIHGIIGNGSAQGKCTGAVNIADNAYHFLVVTYDGTTVRCYVDGSADGTASLSGAISYDTAVFNIGARTSSTDGCACYIDEVGVWSKQLTTTEITSLYNSATGRFYKKDAGIMNGGTTVDSFYNKSLDFDGTDDYVDLGNNSTINLTTNISIEAWIKRDLVASGNQAIVGSSGSGGYILYFYSNDTLAFAKNGQAECTTGTNFITDTSQWHHVAVTYDGANCNIYRDGVLNAGPTSYVHTMSTGLTYTIGASGGGANTFFNGKIDELRISNVVRSYEEIQEGYRAGRDHRIGRAITSDDLSSSTSVPFYVAADRPGTYLEATVGESSYANNEPDTDTDALWHFEESNGTGSYLKDSSGKGNNAGATITGTNVVQGKYGKGRSLDGTDDTITVTDSADWDLGSANATIDWWEYRRDDTDGCAICREGTVAATAFILGYSDASGTIKAYGSTNGSTFDMFTGQSMGPYIASQWVYRAFTRSSTTCKTYMNGVEVNSFTCSGSFVASANPLSFGRYNSGNYANLILDEVSFINGAAKTADDIRQRYELSRRTHPITIDFVSTPQAAYTSGTSMTINNMSGQTNLSDSLKIGDTIIVQENVGGTEYRGTGVVSVIANTSSVYGTITLTSQISQIPSGGYTTSAKVFKWQREYFDLSGITLRGTHDNAITRLTLRVTDGSQGANIWLDDFKNTGSYLTTSTGSTPTSTAQRYYQYRFIDSSADPAVSANITAVTQNYTVGPTTDEIMRHGKWFNAAGVLQPFWWAR